MKQTRDPESDFTGGFRSDRRGPVSDDEMPDGQRAQPGVGDVEEQFRAVTRGFGTMHQGCDVCGPGDPLLELSPDQDLNDIQRDAGEASRAAIDFGGGELDLGDDLDVGGDLL